MSSIFKSTIMSATEQVSHARNVFLFGIFQINLQIVFGGRGRGSHLMMSLTQGVAVLVLVLEPLATLGENVEIKSSG